MTNTAEVLKKFAELIPSRVGANIMRGAQRLISRNKTSERSNPLSAEEFDDLLADINKEIVGINARTQFHNELMNPVKPLKVGGVFAMRSGTIEPNQEHSSD